MNEFQCETIEQLKEYNMLLRKSDEAQVELIGRLERCGGNKTVRLAVKNMMPVIISNELSNTCTWVIQKGVKHVIGKMFVWTIVAFVISGMSQITEMKTEDVIHAEMQNWVRISSSRINVNDEEPEGYYDDDDTNE
ncbi:hypothetical protein QAD02_021680 [Eretmocerus hayati]|uniref:Uncharacterized protein n=1 Tax=Eretmocerus hayati TaxID=131215 RepID=A0ACC2PU34_9HYME|nr:hypothetical protein QAD02_021680 [Eretmocerus hayati]